MNIRLNDNYSLSAEPYKKGLRLIALNNNVELACRIESIKNLSEFISAEEARVFKGRLQLHKHQDIIAVQVKEKIIGNLTASQFEDLLNRAIKH